MKNMHTANCLILQNRNALKLVPNEFNFYFNNARRSFYLYFRDKQEMRQMMKILERQSIKYNRRPSMLPSKSQYEDIVGHCQYKQLKKYKKVQVGVYIDLKKHRSEKLMHAGQYALKKSNTQSQVKKESIIEQVKQQRMKQQQIIVKNENEIQIEIEQKQEDILRQKLKYILEDKILLNKLLKTFK